MKKWLIASLALALLLPLNARPQLAENGKCPRNPDLDPALRAGERRACELRQLAPKCEKAADERKLAGSARTDFIEKCEGFSKPAKKRSGR